MKFTNHLLQLVRKLFFMVSVYSIWHWESVTKTCNCMTARGVDCSTTQISVYCRELVPWCRGKCLFPVSRSRFVHDLVFPILTKFPSMKRRTNLIHPPFSSQIKMFFFVILVYIFFGAKLITVNILSVAMWSFYCLWWLYLSAKASTSDTKCVFIKVWINGFKSNIK